MGPEVAPDVRVFPDPGALASAAARHVLARARVSVRARGRFTWVLAGGRTPEALYRILARRYRRTFPWAATEVFFGDERCVGPRDPDSNYGMAREALLARVPIPRHRVHRLRGEVRPASAAAAGYAARIGPIVPVADGGTPRFDLVLLGIGPDGHTASLFPGTPAVRERRRAVVAVPRAGRPPKVPRLTLTLPALASSREVVFLAEGTDKAAIVGRVLRSGPGGDPRLPASQVRSDGPIRWFLDRPAAAERPVGSTPR